jgi:5-methylcytosine-specific restriction endonuclease McrA
MTYQEKLKSPLWQKKRLEVMEWNGWQCRNCGSNKDMLTVHHFKYELEKEPWDYKKEELTCLCEICHKKVHAATSAFNTAMKDCVGTYGFINLSGEDMYWKMVDMITGHKLTK